MSEHAIGRAEGKSANKWLGIEFHDYKSWIKFDHQKSERFPLTLRRSKSRAECYLI